MIQTQAEPYVGTAYLNGAAKSAGHEFVLHLGTDLTEINETIEKEKPDLIGFSCMTCFYTEMVTIARDIKKRTSAAIIMGGPHPTLFPDIIDEPAIDIICRGEGEYALIDLLDAIEKKTPIEKIKNLWVKRNGKVHKNELRPLADPLDDLPLIDWTCYIGTPVPNLAPVAFPIRGCPYSCSYCFNEKTRELYKGKGCYVRHFSVDRTIEEIKQAFKVFAPSPLVFTSDSFGFDLKWMDELFSRYTKLTKLPFVLLFRPELATEECVSIIAKYKCMSVAIGVESGSERVRKEILNRHYSNQMLVDVANRFHRHSIKFRTYNMIGLPTETEREVWETIDINIAMKADFPRGAIFTPFPNTKIVELAMEKGYLDRSFSYEDVPNTILSTTVLKRVDKDLIRNQLYFFQSAIIFPKLKGFFKKLTRMKPNILFRLWFYFIYASLHRKLEGRKLIPYIKYLYLNRRYV